MGPLRSQLTASLAPPSTNVPPLHLQLPPPPLPFLSCSYEIMSPETIGLQRHDEAGIVLGKHSGR